MLLSPCDLSSYANFWSLFDILTCLNSHAEQTELWAAAFGWCCWIQMGLPTSSLPPNSRARLLQNHLERSHNPSLQCPSTDSSRTMGGTSCSFYSESFFGSVFPSQICLNRNHSHSGFLPGNLSGIYLNTFLPPSLCHRNTLSLYMLSCSSPVEAEE